jgi:HEPN domain-containing protein
MAKADFLKEKAEDFFDDAQYDVSKQKWFLAAFHLEQACQLYLKYYLFLRIADFPKTHSLRDLLADIGQAYNQKEKIKKIVESNAQIIADLEEAYITSRYLPVEFNESQVKLMEKFIKGLIKFLKRL